MTFSLAIRSHSETGPLRKNNQDSAISSPNLLVVADGMGGAAAGDLASAVAIQTISKADVRLEGEQMLTRLGGAVSAANDTLADLVADDHSLEGMGTTVCGAMFSGTQFGLVHIGDSRGYLLRGGKLERLTVDHSWVMSLVLEGKITEAESEVHPHRNLLLKVLNGQPSLEPDERLVDAELGDRIMFCSDGVCGFTTDEIIAKCLANDDLDEAMAQLVQAAYDGGGADNITAIIAEVVAQDEELDAAPPVILGAASDTEIPQVARASLDLEGGPEASDDSPEAPRPLDEDDLESIRYAPTVVKKRRWVAPVVSTIVVLAALAGILVGGIAYGRTRYFVGAENDTVAIFNGVPGGALGITFSRAVEHTDISLNDLPPFYRDGVRSTIPADNRAAAQQTVRELQQMAANCRAVRAQRPSQTPSASPGAPASPGSSTAPGPSASAASSPGPAQPTGTGTGVPSTPDATGSTSTAPGQTTEC